MTANAQNDQVTIEQMKERIARLESLLDAAQATGKAFETKNLELQADLNKLKEELAKANVPTTFWGKMKANWAYIVGGVGVGAAAGAGGMYYASRSESHSEPMEG